jgi:uncharacterized protein (TIGR00730 family)
MSDQPAENRHNILNSPSYRVAYKDVDFLARPELRAARLELELLKPELYLHEHNVRSTIVVFGSTRLVEPSAAIRQLEQARQDIASTPDDAKRQRDVAIAERLLERSHYYETAREFARLVSTCCQKEGQCDNVIVTGGGPGIMEAANRGAYDVAAKSVGLNIRLPREQQPNPYITPDLCFQFHYFAMRKLHFLLRAKALVVFPGGFGTFDELFDALTLRQTGRMQAIPVILVGREYWQRVINFQFLADEGMIADQDLDLFDFAETAPEIWAIVKRGARGEGSGIRG